MPTVTGTDICDACQRWYLAADKHDCKKCGSFGGVEVYSFIARTHLKPCGGCGKYYPLDHKHWRQKS